MPHHCILYIHGQNTIFFVIFVLHTMPWMKLAWFKIYISSWKLWYTSLGESLYHIIIWAKHCIITGDDAFMIGNTKLCFLSRILIIYRFWPDFLRRICNGTILDYKWLGVLFMGYYVLKYGCIKNISSCFFTKHIRCARMYFIRNRIIFLNYFFCIIILLQRSLKWYITWPSLM